MPLRAQGASLAIPGLVVLWARRRSPGSPPGPPAMVPVISGSGGDRPLLQLDGIAHRKHPEGLSNPRRGRFYLLAPLPLVDGLQGFQDGCQALSHALPLPERAALVGAPRGLCRRLVQSPAGFALPAAHAAPCGWPPGVPGRRIWPAVGLRGISDHLPVACPCRRSQGPLWKACPTPVGGGLVQPLPGAAAPPLPLPHSPGRAPRARPIGLSNQREKPAKIAPKVEKNGGKSGNSQALF